MLNSISIMVCNLVFQLQNYKNCDFVKVQTITIVITNSQLRIVVKLQNHKIAIL